MVGLGSILTLERNVLFFDLETHDKVPPEQSRIVEIAVEIHKPDGSVVESSTLLDPGVPISEGATGVHGITNEMVRGQRKFHQVAQQTLKLFSTSDLGGYNIKQFDVRVMQEEFARANISWSYTRARILDPLRLWQVLKPRTLTDAVRQFCGREPSEAHRAAGDTKDSREVLIAMLQQFPDLPRTVQGLHDLCYPPDPDNIDSEGKFKWRGDEPTIAFGKHAGVALHRVPSEYLDWIANKGTFAPEVKTIAREALAGRFPEKQLALGLKTE